MPADDSCVTTMQRWEEALWEKDYKVLGLLAMLAHRCKTVVASCITVVASCNYNSLIVQRFLINDPIPK